MSSDSQPLRGIRVVEVAGRIAGPFATRVLAELGADVVKVEPPGGDPARRSHPVAFATGNRAKRSVVSELDSDGGREALHDLLARADVLVCDLPAARAAALGLDAAAATARHPHLIVASVPPYPAGHPRADEPATESLVLAAEGFMDEQQGNRPGPVFIRLPFASWCAAHLLLGGILARLLQRERTGVVAPVATSLLQGALAPAALYWQRWDRLPAPPPGQTGSLGNGREHTLPKRWPDAALSIFQCADGEWVQLAGAVGGWIESPPALEALALADEVDLSEVGVTPDNRERWNEVFRTRTAREWTDRFRTCDVPCVISARLGDCFTSEQVAANGYVVEVDDPAVGRLLQAGAPLTVERATVEPATRPAPALGATTVAGALAGWDPRPAPTVAAGARPDPPLPLAGMRALDVGAAVAGPFGAQCLADLGAEVIKVEPITGDRGRGLTQFAGCHRGKRSLAVDLKSDAGRELLGRLLAGTDAVLHNMRLRAAARLGLDGPGLRASNPRIVLSHISAYGTRGPMADDPGYDPTAQALTGWEHADAGPGMPPIWLRNSAFDVQSGLLACAGAVLGLLVRERGGDAPDVRTSLLAAGIAASSEVAADPIAGTPTPVDELDADQAGISPRERIHRLADGWLAVAATEPEQAAALDSVLGAPEERELRLREREVAATVAELRAAGVPAVPVAEDRRDAFLDAEANRRLGLSRTLETTGYGRIDVVGGFWSLGERPQQDEPESIPDFGEDTEAILAELGYAPEAIAALLSDGVAGTRASRAEVCHA